MRQHAWIIPTAMLLGVTSSPMLCTSAFTPAIVHRTRSHPPRSPVAFVDNGSARKPVAQSSSSAVRRTSSPLWQWQRSRTASEEQRRPLRWWRRALRRFDTIQSAPGLVDDDENDAVVLTAGLFGKIKKLHDPITYFVLGILAGFRWDWCFKSPVYWFAIGFTIKWFRARYVFKIPVWDRQPNWNNIITSKEQEKDLRALTCKNCGSTIFIAKTREFFFEGDTGIGGLGCFACGAKGKDNFVEDRDRIVEDVGDMDDYFEYERPLDFVTRAERRKLMKEAKGDEEKANQLLIDRQSQQTQDAPSKSSSSEVPPADVIDAVIEEPAAAETVEEETKEAVDEVVEAAEEEKEEHATSVVEAKEEDTEATSSSSDSESIEAAETAPEPADEKKTATVEAASTEHAVPEDAPQPKTTHVEKETVPVAKQAKPATVEKKQTTPPKKAVAAGPVDLDGLDALDMDAF